MTPPITASALAASSIAHKELRTRSKGVSSRERQGELPGERQANSKAWTRSERYKYRQSFPERWQAFIATEFDDAVHAAYEFGCDPDTAAAWIEGRSAPSGPFVGMALARWPQKALRHLAGSFK